MVKNFVRYFISSRFRPPPKEKVTIKLLQIVLVLSIVITAGCDKSAPTSGAPDQWQARPMLETQMQEQVQYFRLRDPTIRRFFDDSYGLMVFPNIFKPSSADSGAFGRGQVYEMGNLVGTVSVSQETADFSTPSEYFREIVFFKNKADFDNFKAHGLIFDPQVIGIALSEGVAAKSDYTNGMAVFIMADTGPMADASLAGQKFIYAPTP